MPRIEQEIEPGILTREETEFKEPQMYRVVLLNDHYTTMEFVVLVLEKVFNRSVEEANEIMLKVHNTGSGTAGVYTREIAETKIAIVQRLAEKNEFPLRCVLEPIV